MFAVNNKHMVHLPAAAGGGLPGRTAGAVTGQTTWLIGSDHASTHEQNLTTLSGGWIAIGATVGLAYNGRHDGTHNAYRLPLHPAGTGVHPAGAGHVLRNPSVSCGRLPAADMAWWSV